MKKSDTQFSDMTLPFAIITVSLFLILILVALFLWPDMSDRPDYAAPPGDDQAISMPDDLYQNIGQDPDEPDSEIDEDGTRGSAIWSETMTVDTQNKSAVLIYQNPSKADSSTQLDIYIDGVLVKKTGLIPPGYGITEIKDMDLSGIDFTKENLTGVMSASHYDTKTNEKAIFTWDMPVKIVIAGD